MSFGEAISTCFSKYATFSGRARRSEYWYFTLFNLILSGVVSIFKIQILVTLVSIALLLPGLGVGVRRLHDIGKSGWYLLIGLIPVVGAILLIVWYCRDSDPGSNAYGPNPKGNAGAGSFSNGF